jgi:hypothetical protein
VSIKKTISYEQENSMNATWIDFCKESNAAQDQLPFEHVGWFAWIDYAAMHYHEPLPAVTTDWQEVAS